MNTDEGTLTGIKGRIYLKEEMKHLHGKKSPVINESGEVIGEVTLHYEH